MSPPRAAACDRCAGGQLRFVRVGPSSVWDQIEVLQCETCGSTLWWSTARAIANQSPRQRLARHPWVGPLLLAFQAIVIGGVAWEEWQAQRSIMVVLIGAVSALCAALCVVFTWVWLRGRRDRARQERIEQALVQLAS